MYCLCCSLENRTGEEFVRIHTETLLITLPTPDFSMPYNVICLACTVVAIAFGCIHNLTTRRFTLLDPTKKKGLKTKIKDFVAKLKGKKESKAEEVKEETKDENNSNNSAVNDESENFEDEGENDNEGEQSDDREIQFNFKRTKIKPRRR